MMENQQEAASEGSLFCVCVIPKPESSTNEGDAAPS